jgi:hypothetical protein
MGHQFGLEIHRHRGLEKLAAGKRRVEATANTGIISNVYRARAGTVNLPTTGNPIIAVWKS